MTLGINYEKAERKRKLIATPDARTHTLRPSHPNTTKKLMIAILL